jgi:8-oxo-dGTP pyrophosphatase MutT (NUDIX family)
MHPSLPPSLQRHIDSCNNIHLPAGRLPFDLAGTQVGWIDPEILPALTEIDGVAINAAGVSLADPAALPDIAEALAAQGFYKFRGEAFDVCAGVGTPPLSTIDRGALPSFGIEAVGVHMNGLVRRADGLHLWVARRAANKLLDPGKLDHLVAGGVSAGMNPLETLIKEAGEEAAITPALAGQATLKSRLSYTMMRQEGLRRDTLFCYDLELPEDFIPVAADGEVEAFELWPIGEVVRYVAETDEFKFNVSLVLIDLFKRLGMVP